MKKLLLAIVLIGSLFAETIVYKKKSLVEDRFGDITSEKLNTAVSGEYLGISDGNAYIRKDDGNIEKFNCDIVVIIFDANEQPIQYDCLINTCTPQILTEIAVFNDVLELKENPQHKIPISGLFFAMGGYFLYTNLDKECDDCNSVSEVADFSDKRNSQQKMGYVFIILGGIFMLFEL